MVAGNATTAHTITEAFYLLISNPDQMELVVNDHSLIPNMVEEALRLLTPTNNMWRIATEDTELEGVAIPKGSVILIRYGSGNRDEDLFENPDKFDVMAAKKGRDFVDKTIIFGTKYAKKNTKRQNIV